jgi:hypothetical protein
MCLKLMEIGSVEFDIVDQLVRYMLYSIVIAFGVPCYWKLVWVITLCVN